MSDIALPEPLPIHSTHFDSTVRVVVYSFGFLHGPAPEAHLTVDLRLALHDPHFDPAMGERTGLEPVVRDHVLATPGTGDVLRGVATALEGMLPGHDRKGLLLRVAFGCAGGRHRSVVLANELTNALLRAGIGAEVEHRDVLRPVVRRPELCSDGGA